MSTLSQNPEKMQLANSRNFPDYSEITWAEVSKEKPCPFCQKPDWCSVAENEEAVLCRRKNATPIGWKQIKISKDGYPIYVKQGDSAARSHSFKHPKFEEKPKAKRIPPPDTIALALLLEEKEAAPSPQKILKADGTYRLITRYQYTSDKWVDRIEFFEEGNRTKKEYRQWHRTEDGSVICKKGDKQWPAYQINQALKALVESGDCILVVEGEPCTEAGRSLNYASITFQGSGWKFGRDDEGAIALAQIKAARADAGLIIWPDNDRPGTKKANLLAAACNEAGLWYHIINPEDFDLPEKGDIVDAIKMHGEDEVISNTKNNATNRKEKNLGKKV